ncbi:hypothetical protein KS4_22140 [Poriferisphaera corsica]|uniref:PEP-CTERM protein-sorting domain-containing protein n=1 Tax=Poriferisphaera corsica TaxID=2528020 RepID=A0A517YVG1_9BACT|nr:hypothetical protein [Poriferisphaera corsica]QDU34152.1 hypothetical protein KS4_22140 [Poriferisphaera corsica]
MRSTQLHKLAYLTIATITLLAITTKSHAGFMFEFDYINQDVNATVANVGDGTQKVYAYWKDNTPDLNQLMGTNSMRASLWRTDKNGDISKHYASVVADFGHSLDNTFMDGFARMTLARDTRRGIYQNFDFTDAVAPLKKIDEKLEYIFSKYMKQNGKGFLGWSENMVLGGVWAILKKAIPQLEIAAPIIDPLASGAGWDAYIPSFDALYDNYDITGPPLNIMPERTFVELPNTPTPAVPEPASATLILLGFSALITRPRRSSRLAA